MVASLKSRHIESPILIPERQSAFQLGLASRISCDGKIFGETTTELTHGCVREREKRIDSLLIRDQKLGFEFVRAWVAPEEFVNLLKPQ